MRNARTCLIICLMGFATPSSGDEIDDLLQAYGAMVTQCVQEAADDVDIARQCIGATAQACMEEEDGGYTTLGMSWCLAAETRYWDGVLNVEYQSTRAAFRALDADDQQHFPEFAKRAESLRAAQRAWLVFYEAECALDYAIWGAGSMRNIAGNACQMDMKAARALDLIDKRKTMQ